MTAQQTVQYYVHSVARYHGIPRYIYNYRGTQFTSKFWKELWKLFGTGLRYSTAFRPQTQGIVEQMNGVIGQILRCAIAEMNENRNWVPILSIVELAIHSSPNKSTRYSPFYLNYWCHPIVPANLIDGDEPPQNESVREFCK